MKRRKREGGKVEIKLSDNSRIHFERTKSGAVYVQLLRPGNLRDGHGLLVTATAMLGGKELTNFLAMFEQEKEAA